MNEHMIILGLTDADRYDLELLFEEQGSTAISFVEPPAPAGVAKVLDPLTATVAIGAMALVALWICRNTREATVVRKASTGEELTIRITRTSKCEADVIRQLTDLFS
jgi:hypothetical protein